MKTLMTSYGRYPEGKSRIEKNREHERGGVAIIVVIVLTLLVGFGALAIDIGHLLVVRNELKNAADGGALAGAENLYNGAEINAAATDIALGVATENKSEKVAVEAVAERGHWSFATNTFTPNPSLTVIDLSGLSPAQLDASTDFINACRVTARRSATPAASFLAKIFGNQSFAVEQDSVAYIGFAGTLVTGEVNEPIAICKQSITDEGGNYTCHVGRLTNSGSNPDTYQTGGLSNFTQPCETASAASVRPFVCGGGNPKPIYLDQDVGSVGGMQQTIFDQMADCWRNSGLDSDGDGKSDQPWTIRILVIDCPDRNVGPCSRVEGAVEINVLWMVTQNDAGYQNVPRRMGNWSCGSELSGQQCWDSFVQNFNLTDDRGTPALYLNKTMYFQPSCNPFTPAGTTGGGPFGVRAKYPVLVK